MKKYRVAYSFHLKEYVEIEANNEVEAENEVRQLIKDGDLGNLYEMNVTEHNVWCEEDECHKTRTNLF